MVEQGPVEVLRISVPCDRNAPARVRRELSGVAGIASVCADARLVASEIVSSAVAHAGREPGHELVVCGILRDDCFELSVRDPDADDFGLEPLGLKIVDRVAADWGISRPSGRLVWAQFRVRD